MKLVILALVAIITTCLTVSIGMIKTGNSIISNSSQISDINSFYFTYTKGYAINSYIIYDIKKNDDTYIVHVKQYGKAEEEAVEKEVSKETITKLEEILNKYNVSKWSGFNKTDKNVLDGNSFSCSISMENGKSISASGYMKWPQNYKEVVEELDLFFEDLIK